MPITVTVGVFCIFVSKTSLSEFCWAFVRVTLGRDYGTRVQVWRNRDSDFFPDFRSKQKQLRFTLLEKSGSRVGGWRGGSGGLGEDLEAQLVGRGQEFRFACSSASLSRIPELTAANLGPSAATEGLASRKLPRLFTKACWKCISVIFQSLDVNLMKTFRQLMRSSKETMSNENEFAIKTG